MGNVPRCIRRGGRCFRCLLTWLSTPGCTEAINRIKRCGRSETASYRRVVKDSMRLIEKIVKNAQKNKGAD